MQNRITQLLGISCPIAGPHGLDRPINAGDDRQKFRKITIIYDTAHLRDDFGLLHA